MLVETTVYVTECVEVCYENMFQYYLKDIINPLFLFFFTAIWQHGFYEDHP